MILSDWFIVKISFQTSDNPEVLPSKKSIHCPLPPVNIFWAKGINHGAIQNTLLVCYTLGTPTWKQSHPSPFHLLIFVISLLLNAFLQSWTSPISNHKGQATCSPLRSKWRCSPRLKAWRNKCTHVCLFNQYIRPPFTNSLV